MTSQDRHRPRTLDDRTGGAPAVRLTGLTKRFGTLAAVAGLDLTVSPGETVALLGRNGAGKSTTIAMLLGLVRPDTGSVELFGGPAERAVRAGRIGAVLQECRLPWFATVGELIALARSVYPRPLPAAEIVAAAGLAELTGRRLEKLSGGEAQRAKFGFALAGDPELLVLDEPTAGLDVPAAQTFWATVRGRARQGSAVIYTTHNLAEAEEYADRVVVIARGRVVADGSNLEIRQLAGHRRVSFRLPGEAAGPGVAGLERLPGVRQVQVRGDRVVLTTEEADATVAVLVRSWAPRDLEVTGPALSDAFGLLTVEESGTGEG